MEMLFLYKSQRFNPLTIRSQLYLNCYHVLLLVNKLKSEFYTLIVCKFVYKLCSRYILWRSDISLVICAQSFLFLKLIIAPFENRGQPAQTEFINDHSTKITPKLNTSVRWFTDLIDTEWAVNSGEGKKAAIYLLRAWF